MSSIIIEHFKTLTKIPHCSEEADKLIAFLVLFAEKRGYKTQVDKAKNILIAKGEPSLCLQAHYDMVCMGKAPCIETYIENGLMKAKESSLGADNGMAIAMMMALMDEGRELEFLLTADEEIGLVGAGQVDFKLNAKYMLNLDSEEEAEVYIGCAGGVDIVGTKQDSYIEGKGACYEVAVKGLQGGHSGVDIDKGIPSAIKILGNYLTANKIIQLSSIYAGERRNSISANAVAIIRSEIPLENENEVTVRLLKETPQILSQGKSIIELIYNFKDGVLKHNESLGIPDSSVNLAIISCDEKGGVTIELSARAMDDETLHQVTHDTETFFQSRGFHINTEFKYPAWQPKVTDFTNLVTQEMIGVFGKSKMMAIHAGLECGLIAQKYSTIKFASMGPTIRYPHSTREEVDLASVEKIYEVLLGVIEKVD